MEPSIFEGLLDPPPGYTPEDMEVASPHTFFGEQQVSPDEEKQKRAFRLHSKLEDYSERLRAQEEGYLASQFQKMQAQWSEYEQSLRTTRDEIMGELAKPLPKRQPIQLTEGEKIAAGIGALIDPQSAGRTIQEVYGQAEKRNAEEYELALKEDEIRRRNLMMELESEGDLLSAKYKNAQEILTLETNATLKRIAQKTQAHEGAIQGLWEAAASGNPLGVMFAAQQLGLDPNDEDVQALVKQAQEQEALNQRARLADVQAKEQAVNVKAAQAEAYRAKALLDGAKAGTEGSRKEFLDLQRSIYPFEKYAEISERWARIWKMGEDIKVDRERLRIAREKKDTRSDADIRGSINAKYNAMKEELNKQYRDAERAAQDAQDEYYAATNAGEQVVARAKIIKARETARAIEDQITELEKDRQADLGSVYGGTQPTGGQPAEGTTKEGITWRVKGNPNPSGGTVNTRGGGGRAAALAGRGGASPVLAGLAQEAVGTPYVYGGTNPTKGTDCSGLTYEYSKRLGAPLPRNAWSAYKSHSGWSDVGGIGNAQAGDVILVPRVSGGKVTEGGREGHAGIYMGYWDNQHWVMDASTDTGKVSIRPYSKFAASRQKFHKFIRPKKERAGK